MSNIKDELKNILGKELTEKVKSFFTDTPEFA